MKMREMIRRSCYVAGVSLLCFGPGAFAQPTISSTASVTKTTGVFLLGPFDWDRKKKKKNVAADEGGSAALYLLLAGLACSGAIFMRTRRTQSEESL